MREFLLACSAATSLTALIALVGAPLGMSGATCASLGIVALALAGIMATTIHLSAREHAGAGLRSSLRS